MKERWRRWLAAIPLKRFLPTVGYVAFYVLVFVVSCYLTFPYERLRDRIVAEVAAQRGKDGSAWLLEIDELGPSWFTGLHARGVRATPPAPPKALAADDKPSAKIVIDEVTARLGLVARLFGTTRVSFAAQAFGGEIEGVYGDSSAERLLEVDIRDVVAQRMDALSSLVGLPIGGTLKGAINVAFPERKFTKGNGSVRLTLTEAAVGDGKASLQGLVLPKLNVGELTVDAEVKEGTVKVTKLAATGPDVELQGDGKITLRDPPVDSSADIYLRFKINDVYKGKNEMTKTLFGAPGSSMPPVFELVPNIRASKRSDGFYGWHLLGPLPNLRFDPYAGTPPGGGTGTKKL